MNEHKKSLGERWEEFRPSKGVWIWSCAACVALTMILGFTVGGWHTAGTVEELVSDARDNGRAELVASVCVERFTTSATFSEDLAALKEADSWNRDDLVEDGGWVTLVGMEEPLASAADLCANTLADMDAPAGMPADPMENKG